MWHREDLKERARLALKSNGYWIALAALIVFAVLAGGPVGGASGISRSLNTEYLTDVADTYAYLDPGHKIPLKRVPRVQPRRPSPGGVGSSSPCHCGRARAASSWSTASAPRKWARCSARSSGAT